MNKDLTILKITKNELAQLEKIKGLLLSEDFETRYLGYKMFVNTSFYKRCKPKSLFLFICNYFSFFDEVISLKQEILKNKFKIPESQVWRIYEQYINNLNSLYRSTSIEVPVPEEKELFKKIYEDLINTENLELIQNARNQFLGSRTIQDNRNKLFKYEGLLWSLQNVITAINLNKRRESLITSAMTKEFIYNLAYNNIKFYEMVPIKGIIEE